MRSPVFGKRGQRLHAFGIVHVMLLRDIVCKVELRHTRSLLSSEAEANATRVDESSRYCAI